MRFVAAIVLVLGLCHCLQAEDRKPITLTADQLAPNAIASETPVAGKWWLRRGVDGVPGGALLMTGKGGEEFVKNAKVAGLRTDPNLFLVPSMVPAFEVDPKLTGWYRIDIGMPGRKDRTDSSQPMLFARLSDEPYPEYVRVSQKPADGPIDLVPWRSADLTGKKLRFEPVPGPGRFLERGWLGGMSHIVFTPLSPAEIAAAKAEESLPPVRQRLFGIFDSTTEFNNWSHISGPDDVRASIYRHQRAGFGRVYFRAWGSACDTSCTVPGAAPRWTDEDEKKFMKEFQCSNGWKYYIDIIRQHDLMKIAAEEGKKRGVEIHAYIRLTNLNRAPYCDFWHDHPEFRGSYPVRDKDGKLVRFEPNPNLLSFAYPEVRSFYVRMLKQLVDAGAEGLLLDLLRHPPICNLETPVTDRLKNKHGVDIWSVLKPKEDFRTFLNSDPRGLAVQREFFEDFLKELRAAVGPKIEISVRARTGTSLALDGPKFVADGLVDTILDSGYLDTAAAPRSKIQQTLAAVGTKGRAFAVAAPFNADPVTWKGKPGGLEAPGLLALAKLYREQKVHGFGVYESVSFLFDPDRARAIRQASREFAK